MPKGKEREAVSSSSCYRKLEQLSLQTFTTKFDDQIDRGCRE